MIYRVRKCNVNIAKVADRLNLDFNFIQFTYKDFKKRIFIFNKLINVQ